MSREVVLRLFGLHDMHPDLTLGLPRCRMEVEPTIL